MEFNVDPYHDDFEQNAKNNNYVKILFKPGYSVQARELTQIQSILQNQIKSFGDHIFQDGSPVIGGNLTLDNKVSYLMLDSSYNNEDIEIDSFLNNIIIRDSDGLVQAKVMAGYYPAGGTPTLLIKYISGATFNDADVLKVAGTSVKAKCVDSSSSGFGSIVSINDGIFYVNGYFVQVLQQTAVVAPYSQNANVKIGLEISDEVVDYVVDSSLLDPAQSSFNYQAPGADRYQFSLNLSTRPLETAVDESSFFELMRVENGAITKQVKYPIYSEIEKTLARRTYDESGDYTITPFVASISQATDDNQYTISLSPGKAYVKGFEFETLGTFKMDVDKPRTQGIDTKNLVDIDVDTSYGNYLKFKNVYGSTSGNSFLDILNTETVDLHCVPSTSVTVGGGVGLTADKFIYDMTKIGTAKVKNIQRDSTSGESTFDSNGIYRVYFTDINVKPAVVRIPANGTASSINLGVYASAVTDAYANVDITVLPISLTPVANVNTANVFVNSTRVNANSLVASVFTNNVSIGDIIRVGSDVRSVVSVSAAGDYLTVNSAFTKSVSGTNATTNPLLVYKQAYYTSNVTGQSRTITSYNGTTKIATLDRAFDDNSVPTQNTVVQLNFGIKDLECLIEGNSSVSVVNAHANVSIQSKLLNGDVELFEQSKNSMIYQLPRDFVQRGSMNNVDYVHTKYLTRTGVSGVFQINSGNGLDASESLPWAITNSAIQDNLIVMVRSGSGNAGTYPNGSILQLSTGQVTASGSGIQLALNSTITDIDVYINIKENNAEVSSIRTKTLNRNTTYTSSPFNYPGSTGVTADYTVNVANKGNVAKINVSNGLVFITDPTFAAVDPGDSISLFVPDVVNVRKVLMGNTTASADATNFTDVTDWFNVDHGVRDNIYDHAKLVLKQGYSVPTGQLTVHVDFYKHTYPAGASYFCVDSYPNTVYSAGEIPVYVSKTGTYYLRDCLDFRPTRRIGLSDGTIDQGRLSAPDSVTELSYSYYLPRIDKLVLSKNKEFRMIQGIAAAKPVPPEDSDDAMTLYNVYLPPYVANVSDIRLKYIENRRYTMKDISSIDKRVNSLEYYTALSNIESTALNDPTSYEDGTDKAKYGIIGEGFSNYNIADYKNPDFTAIMENGTAVPAQVAKVERLSLVSHSSTTDNDKTITLDYTEVPAIIQDVTSGDGVSVQPFLFAQFTGHVVLTPEVDPWVSEVLKPEVVRPPEVTVVETIHKVIKETIKQKPKKTTVRDHVKHASHVSIKNPGDSIPATPAQASDPVSPPVVTPGPTPTVTQPSYNVPASYPPLWTGYSGSGVSYLGAWTVPTLSTSTGAPIVGSSLAQAAYTYNKFVSDLTKSTWPTSVSAMTNAEYADWIKAGQPSLSAPESSTTYSQPVVASSGGSSTDPMTAYADYIAKTYHW